MAHKVGSDIDAWCTRCRLDTIHVVVSLSADGEKAKRVECKSCGGQHNFRAPKSGPNTKTKRASKKTSKKTSKKAAKRTARKSTRSKSKSADTRKTIDWSDRVAALLTSGAEPAKYSIRGEYVPDDFIAHLKFGQGIVVELVATNKISVMFEDGLRTLMMKHQ